MTAPLREARASNLLAAWIFERGCGPWLVAVVIVGSVACSSGACRAPAPSAPVEDPVTVRLLDAEAAAAELWPKVRNVAYVPATAEQKRALGDLIAALWRGVSPTSSTLALAGTARDAGMTLELWTIVGAPWWVVREPEASRAGHG